MNWDRIEGQWQNVRGKARQRWAKLTDDDINEIDGNREELAGRLQKAYGWSRDQIEDAIRDFEVTFDEAAYEPPDSRYDEELLDEEETYLEYGDEPSRSPRREHVQ